MALLDLSDYRNLFKWAYMAFFSTHQSVCWFCSNLSVSRNLRLPEEASPDWWSNSEASGAAAQNHLHHSSKSIKKCLLNLMIQKYKCSHRNTLSVGLFGPAEINPRGIFCQEWLDLYLLVITCIYLISSFHQLHTTTLNGALLKDLKSLSSNLVAIRTTWKWSSARFELSTHNSELHLKLKCRELGKYGQTEFVFSDCTL